MSAPIMSRFDLFFVVLDDCNETSDYNIARHILAMHRHKDEAMDPEFSADQLQRYIKHARRIKPILSSDSAALLVEKYCSLRQNDLTSVGGQGSYRMTVRQLESMIRLSEALARAHHDPEIRPRYVREAYRLLKSSIIRVETENIDLLVDDPLGMAVDSTASTQLAPQDSAYTGSIPAQTISDASGPLSMKFEAYVRISNLLVYKLRRQDTTDEIGMKKTQLIEWYLEQIEGEIESEAELHRREREVKAVIERLIHKDCILIELKEAGQTDPVLVVHPNYQPA